jgi:HK97 family phage portal protein
MLDRLWAWFGMEKRALDYADPALAYLGAGQRTVTGEPVDLERSVSLSAVWACTSLIAGCIASMPLILYRRLADDSRAKAIEHPLFDVLRLRPNPVQSVTAFWEAMTTALLLRGNAYATLTRYDDGRVRALWYVNPTRVSIEVLKTGRLKYKIATGGQTQTVDAANMLHVCGPLSDDGYTGRSVISSFRETLGLGLAMERYAGEFFTNASTPRGVLRSDKRLHPEALERLKQSLTEAHGSPGRRHKTIVLEEGLQWQQLSISHEDSQFIEVRRFTVEEICRIFLVPADMVNGDVRGSLTYSKVETRALHLLKFCIGPWLSRIESAVNYVCVSPLERRQLYAEYLPDALLQTDIEARYRAYEKGIASGFLTVDEVRRRENLPPLPADVPALG